MSPAFLAVIGLLAFKPVARAAPPTASSTPGPAAAAPLSLADFLAPAALRLPTLSPSGKAIAVVRRDGDLDAILRVDLPGLAATEIFRTSHLTPGLVKRGFRQNVSYLAWKSDDILVASVDTPVGIQGDDSFAISAPMHIILDAQRKALPLFLNTRRSGAKGTMELSWIQSLLKNDPAHVMVGYRKLFAGVQLDRVAIADGTRQVLERGGEDVIGYETDAKGDILTRTLQHVDGTLTLQGRQPGQAAWLKIFDFRNREERALAKYDLLGLGERGLLYVAAKPDTPSDGDTTVVRTFDLTTMKLGPVVWSNPTWDVDSIVQDSETHDLMGGCYWVDTLQCQFNSAKLTANFRGLNRFFDNKRSVTIISQSDDDAKWILLVSGPEEPAVYFLYDVAAHHVDELGDAWSAPTSAALGKMRRLDFKARDGAPLFAYVTEPPKPAAGLLPLVVMPHGGPEGRDYYAFDLMSQFLATRGYLVLQPTFRGSSGFGRKFAESGYHQWGGRMHEDVMDATRTLIAEGRVDPKRVCVVGASYGGYEALYAAATEAAAFRCAVSIDGISDLVDLMKWEKHFGRDSPRFAYWMKSIGDPEADRTPLAAKSPIAWVRDWTTPLLLVHGDSDQIVPVEQSRKMQRALTAAGKPVRYLEVKDMGHGPSSDEEITKVLGAVDAFLALYLGPPAPAPAPRPMSKLTTPVTESVKLN